MADCISSAYNLIRIDIYLILDGLILDNCSLSPKKSQDSKIARMALCIGLMMVCVASVSFYNSSSKV